MPEYENLKRLIANIEEPDNKQELIERVKELLKEKRFLPKGRPSIKNKPDHLGAEKFIHNDTNDEETIDHVTLGILLDRIKADYEEKQQEIKGKFRA